MTQQQTNIGAAPNDGTGDTLRDAFSTVNANATDAETRLTAVEPVPGYHTSTASVSGGSVTLDTTGDSLRYIKEGTLTHIQGSLVVSSVSTPTGTNIQFTLPFAAADLTDLGGIVGAGVAYLDSSTSTWSLLPFVISETSTVAVVFIDASTIEALDQFRFTFSYETA